LELARIARIRADGCIRALEGHIRSLLEKRDRRGQMQRGRIVAILRECMLAEARSLVDAPLRKSLERLLEFARRRHERTKISWPGAWTLPR
jgi:hypothetical protein